MQPIPNFAKKYDRPRRPTVAAFDPHFPKMPDPRASTTAAFSDTRHTLHTPYFPAVATSSGR